MLGNLGDFDVLAFRADDWGGRQGPLSYEEMQGRGCDLEAEELGFPPGSPDRDEERQGRNQAPETQRVRGPRLGRTRATQVAGSDGPTAGTAGKRPAGKAPAGSKLRAAGRGGALESTAKGSDVDPAREGSGGLGPAGFEGPPHRIWDWPVVVLTVGGWKTVSLPDGETQLELIRGDLQHPGGKSTPSRHRNEGSLQFSSTLR
ncbi:hypothetical protein NDU88_006198 [Pleurodeles waltl]|uniref:Uncharacterized protein n=1 Tax=Pleurodeles waltl TaxID=8319 RepID=A0AAV7LR86_PLEWA|nr:hypothetical protein NDU88_006198 [Pleurodeles waltl]